MLPEKALPPQVENGMLPHLRNVNAEAVNPAILGMPWIKISPDDFAALCNQIAGMVGVDPQDERLIAILHEENKPDTCIAQCQSYNYDGVYSRCEVSIGNTIRALVNDNSAERNNILKIYGQLGVHVQNKENENDIKIEDPLELLVASLSEDFDHARYYFEAGSIAQVEIQQNQYIEELTKSGKIINDGYECSHLEMEGGRKMLQVLRDFFVDTRPDRSRYFDSLLQKSIKDGSRPLLDLTQLISSLLRQYSDTKA